MELSKKQFDAYASAAKPGDVFLIKKAAGWARFDGWHSHRWHECIFVSFDGKELVLEYKNEDWRLIVKYSQIKAGEIQIIWNRSDVFLRNWPTDFEKNNVLKMWNPGELTFYK